MSAGHAGDYVDYVVTFVAIWWAWNNWTWFSSAYDCDDVVYRLLSFGVMTGALIMAAGVPDLFAHAQSSLAVAGYAVMRFAQVGLWLRAAHDDLEHRRTALMYAVGISVVQLLWIARLAIHDEAWLLPTFVLGMLLEFAVPIVAERTRATPFHPHHIAERYGLFTIIVLGEVVLSSVMAVQGALAEEEPAGHAVGTVGMAEGGGEVASAGVDRGDLVLLVLGGLLLVFGMWWTYFRHETVDLFHSSRTVFVVGLGHLPVFAAIGATGAALAAAVDVVGHHSESSVQTIGFALAVPVAVYALVLGALHALDDGDWASFAPAPVFAVLVLAGPLLGASMGVTVLLLGVLMALAVAYHLVLDQREAAAA